MRYLAVKTLMAAVVATVSVFYTAIGEAEAGYIQTNLVSDVANLAELQDTALVNPWGISFSSTSPIWVSNQASNTTTLYSISSSLVPTKVMPIGTNGTIPIPPGGSGAVGPTGQVNNSTTSFQIPVMTGPTPTPAHFIFANLNGTISAWAQGQTPAAIEATTPGAIYTGLAIGSVGATPYLYAANGAGGGNIQVFDGTFANVTGTTFMGKFVDPNPVPGYVPFNAQNIGGQIYVTYAPATMGADRTPQTMATAGQGYVDVFDTSGTFLQRLINVGGVLAAPWGIALAPPTGFGQFSGDLLVGNFSYADSVINAFDPMSGMFEGTIPIGGPGYLPGGLWALEFGIGGSNGSPDTLYFTNGIDGETHGLFGAITVAVAEPPGLTVLAVGFVFLGVWQFARRSRAART